MDDIISPNAPQKQCKGPCGRTLPATSEYFHSQKAGKYGFRSTCKVCRKTEMPLDEKRAYSKLYHETHKERENQRSKEYARTHKEEARQRSHLPHNMEKHRQESRRYAREHREQRKQYGQRYYREKFEQISAQKRAYNIAHADEVKRHHQAYYQANREEIIRRQRIRAQSEVAKRRRKIYEAENAEYIRSHAYSYRRNHLEEDSARARLRRARKKSVLGTHTAAQIQEQLKRQRYRCYYAACGFSKFPRVKGKYLYQVEHTFPLSRVAGTDIPANDISYLVLSCDHCNGSKSSKYPWEWPQGGRLL